MFCLIAVCPLETQQMVSEEYSENSAGFAYY